MQQQLAGIGARIEYDPEYTLSEAAAESADIFSDAALIQANYAYLDQFYILLRSNPELSKALFSVLIEKHNSASEDSKPERIFIPGCCCCGVDTNIESSQSVITNLDAIDYAAIGELGAELKKYRTTVHAPGTMENKKKDGARELGLYLYQRLTSRSKISQNEASALYETLKVNECVAAELFALVKMGANLAGLANAPPSQEPSPITARLRAAFGIAAKEGGGGGGGGGGGNGGGGGGGGGGCCCCCCCCCCGGGC